MRIAIGPFVRTGPDPQRLTTPLASGLDRTDDGLSFGDLLTRHDGQGSQPDLQSFAGTGTLGLEQSAATPDTSNSSRMPQRRAPAEAALQNDAPSEFTPAAGATAQLDLTAPGEASPSAYAEMATARPEPANPPPEPPSAAPSRAPPAAIAAIDISPASPGGDAQSEMPAERQPGAIAPGADAHASAVAVTVETVDGLLRAHARLPACEPAERARLTRAAEELLGEYAAGAEFIVHTTGGMFARRARGR